MWDHNWGSAIQAYDEALQEAPDNYTAMAGLGLALFQQKNYRESLRIFLRLAQDYPLDPMPIERIARIYEREGLLSEAARSYYQAAELQLSNRDIERAFSDYRAVLGFYPQNQPVRARMALVLSKLGKKEEAVTEFIDLASIVQKTGQPDKAMEILEYSLQIKPDSTTIRDAIETLRNSRPIPMRKLELDLSGAKRMAQVREIETAQSTSDSQSSNDPITEARMSALKEVADILFEENDSFYSRLPASRSATSTEQQLDFHPGPFSMDWKTIKMHISNAIDMHSAGSDEHAALQLESGISGGLKLSAANFLLGLLIQQSDPDKSIKYLKESLNDPNYALASHLLCGEINLNQGRLTEATSHYLHALMLADTESVSEQEALELYQLYEPILASQNMITQEKDMRNLCAAISGQINRQDWRKYILTAREQLPSQPEGGPPLPLLEMLIDSNNSSLVESLAEVQQLVEKGNQRSAMEEAFHALTYAPYYLPLHIQIGDILINEGRVPEAIEKFLTTAKLYTLRNDDVSALHLLNRVARLAPMDISVRKMLIEVLRSNGNIEEMIQQYMDLANVHYLMADLEESRRGYHEALNLSRQVQSSRDQSLTILNRLADIELQSLNWKEAIRIYEQIRNLLPLDPSPRTSLVDLYFRLNMNAAAINEVDAYVKLLTTENNTVQAEKFLNEIANERPTDIEIQKRVASMLFAQGKKEVAISKLDALAEKLLVDNDSAGSAAVVSQIISLNPPNRAEYEKLYQEITRM